MKDGKKETVKDHLVTAVPTADIGDNVEKVIRELRSKRWDSLNYIYVLKDQKILTGVVSVKKLLAAKNEASVSELMTKDLIVAHPHNDQERAGILAIQHDIREVPVVKVGSNEFVGAVAANQIMKILHEEHTEDFLRLSGIQRGHPIVDIFRVSVLRLARLRLWWLLVGLGGGMLATLLLRFFEDTLSQRLMLAFFIPVIVYMSSAVGTQTETIYVRGLSLHHIPLLRYLWRELQVSVIIAAIMAVLMYLFTVLLFGSLDIALVVALALMINIAIAPFIALLIPTVLYWAKKDPALGAGPFITVIQDLFSLIIYFAVASWLLF